MKASFEIVTGLDERHFIYDLEGRFIAEIDAATGATRVEYLWLIDEGWAAPIFLLDYAAVIASTATEPMLYLNPPTLEVLNTIPRLENNPFVICGEKPGAHLVNLEKPWRRIRKAAGLDDVRLHDLRHSYASVAVAGGMSLPMIGALLGHSQPQTTARYAHLSADPLRAANDAVGQRIGAAMGTMPEEGKVLALKPLNNR